MAGVSIDEVLSDRLDSIQKAAATDANPEVLTLACAGSGKSRTLAYRIAWLIAEKAVPAEGIVAFTFTEKAADSIKLRVADALESCGLDQNLIGRMFIGTIHSYCQYVLGLLDARYRQFDVLDDNRLKLFLIENYPALGLLKLKNEKGLRYFGVINDVAQAWTMLNEEMIEPEEIAQHDELLGEILVKLKARLSEQEFFDFSTMQRLAVEALAAKKPRAMEVVSNLEHLLVDEYQDINPVQEALIRHLHKSSKGLFVVGDDDQSIYGWRGADVTRIQTFEERFPEASRHTLATNYRSTRLIVAAADDFARAELGSMRITKEPTAADQGDFGELRRLWFVTREDEANWVVSKIQTLLGCAYVDEPGKPARGLTPADFAILMRSTRQNEPNGKPPRHVAYTSGLQALGVPYTLEAGGSLFDRREVATLRSLFEMLRNGTPDRDELRSFFSERVAPSFPGADFNRLAQTVTRWGRDIHAPVAAGAPRRRIFPQRLLFDVLEALEVKSAELDDATLQDIGVLSRILQDVETVFPSVDSSPRFHAILNFLNVVAETGYDTSSNEIVQRPDAVTVSTVHKMKGLEFPVVFIVDVENNRFPGKRRGYTGLIPADVLRKTLDRGAYCSTREEEARLFYTAMTRAERYLYVTGCAQGPGWRRALKQSPFAAHLTREGVSADPNAPTVSLNATEPRRRIDAASLPTSFSDIRYYMRCPKDYQFRNIFGFSPAIPELFGFGTTVHAAVGKLHERFPNRAPTAAQSRETAEDVFHLKHVRQSQNPEGRPGPYERAKNRAADLVENYAMDYAADFQQRRQVEARFEIPIGDAVVSGAIDLMIHEDEAGNVVDACVIDFKTLEGGEDAANSSDLEWPELALQVQLYAKAARDVLGNTIERGHVHLMKDGERVEVPINDEAVRDAIGLVDWAVGHIIAGDFPMRPEKEKCKKCDFQVLCSQAPETFSDTAKPPAIHVPGDLGYQHIAAFSKFES